MSDHILDSTARSFDADVLEASRAMPVLVDFWADWCGPCKMLAPVLERVAADYAGQARIVKVNTDAEMELAQAQGIRSLPTLRLFRHGKAVDDIIGVQPDSAIRALIERHLERPSDKVRMEAAGLVESGQPEQAVLLLEAVVRDEPDNVDARVELVEALARAGQVDAASEQLQSLPVQAMDAPRLKGIEARLLLARSVAGQPGADELRKKVEQDPPDLAAACALAAHEFLAGQQEPALDRWLGVLRKDRNFDDRLARRCLLAALELMQDEPERVHEYRRKLMAMLH